MGFNFAFDAHVFSGFIHTGTSFHTIAIHELDPYLSRRGVYI